jgi:type I restriction enzyme M protein
MILLAIKKSEIYSSLWESCDELRGGMDASLYKDYVLTLLFVKYVTDRFSGDRFAEIEIPEGGSFKDMIEAKGKSDIGDRVNKIISKLAEANNLSGVIDVADFDDDGKLGSGKEKVDKLTNLVSIFQSDKLDFRKNRAGGDDIIGDAYEYLMKNFAAESGKSKGQFYTPAEVSRIMAQVIGISGAEKASETLYDLACGSGSLLIRTADEAPHGITIYGQENDSTTAGLAKMNLVLHNKATGSIVTGNTLSSPKFKNGESPERFDYAVSNPPFSYKSWSNGVDITGDQRFQGYDATPPDKNGDYAWLMHFIYSLKPKKGKGAIILPHGVLFRGNKEAVIRKNIISKKLIKGIIGLPANLFFGTGIPACIIVIDKENADSSEGLFMINASKGFIKDGNKNRLREQDIRKIVDVFNGQQAVPHFSRMIPYSEIEANDYNLNIPRYIENGDQEDLHDIEAHLLGGIPKQDIGALNEYWEVFPTLQNQLFEDYGRDDYLKIKVPGDEIRNTIYSNSEFKDYAGKISDAFDSWKKSQWDKLNEIKQGDNPKAIIRDTANCLLDKFKAIPLIDQYDVYQCLMLYWEEAMQDDVYAIAYDGWEEGNEIEKEVAKKKDGTATGKMKSFEGRLIPKSLIIKEFYSAQQERINGLESDLEQTNLVMEELKEEHSGEEGLLLEAINDKGNITKGDLQKRLKEIKGDLEYAEEFGVLNKYQSLMDAEAESKAEIKEASADLEKLVFDHYTKLSLEEIKDLVVEKKWCSSIYCMINGIYENISHHLTSRIEELSQRYEQTLPSIEDEVAGYEHKVKNHLERMGFSWQ